MDKGEVFCSAPPSLRSSASTGFTGKMLSWEAIVVARGQLRLYHRRFWRLSVAHPFNAPNHGRSTHTPV